MRGVSSPPDRRAADLRRATRETLGRRDGARRGRRGSRELGVAAIGANHGAGPRRALARARGDAARRARRSPRCRTSASPASPAAASSTRTRRRTTSPSSPRRRGELGARIIGGCCGTTPARDRGDPRGDRRGPRAARRRSSSTSASWSIALGEAPARDRARPGAARGRVGRLGRSSTRRSAARTRRPARGRAGAQGLGQGRASSTSTTTRRARARMSALMVVGRDRAGGRDRDDPARDAARHVDHRASSRCCSARTPRASATSSRSPATRPRSATTRARAASTRSTRSGSTQLIDAPEPRRGLQRPGDRRADLVLRRRRRQPVRRRPRARARPLPRRSSRPARSSR